MIKKLFVEHPQAVGETYFEHMGQAFSFAIVMLGAGAALLLHGIIPGLFVKTGSRAITTLHARMIATRRRQVRQRGREEAPQEVDELRRVHLARAHLEITKTT